MRLQTMNADLWAIEFEPPQAGIDALGARERFQKAVLSDHASDATFFVSVPAPPSIWDRIAGGGLVWPSLIAAEALSPHDTVRLMELASTGFSLLVGLSIPLEQLKSSLRASGYREVGESALGSSGP